MLKMQEPKSNKLLKNILLKLKKDHQIMLMK